MDSLHDVGYWTVDHFSGIASFVFAGTVAIAAAVSARLTRTLVRETIQLRKVETDPFVAVYIEAQRIEPLFIDMVIRNVARGSAYDVSFSVETDRPIWTNDTYRLSNLAVFTDGIRYMAPGQELRFFFGSYVELVKEARQIVVTFFGAPEGGRRVRFEETFTIDPRQFEGMGHVGEAPELTVSNALTTIAKDLQRIREGGSNSNLTVTVRRRYIFSGPINRRWNRLSGRWRNFRIRWTNSEDPWRQRWNRLRRKRGART